MGKDVDFTEALGEERKEKTIKDYTKICNLLNLNVNNLVKPVQTHTNKVKPVNHEVSKITFNNENYKNIDGLTTNKKDVILATSNADCILLIFYDPVKNVIANTHSGWKGTLQTISLETVRKMKSEYGCNEKDIICCICPSIRKCHFEVDEEVKNQFYEKFKNLEQINDIIEETIPNKKWNIDTVLINQIILRKEGLKQENIIDCGICNVCNSDIMHSYRVEKEGFGRNTVIIGLKEEK